MLTVPSPTKTDTSRQPRPGMLTPDDANPPPAAQKERRGTHWEELDLLGVLRQLGMLS